MAATKNTKAFYNSEIPKDWFAPDFGDVFTFLKTFSFSREQLTSESTTDEIRNIHYGDIHATYENEILDLDIEKTIPFLIDGIIDLKCFEDENFPVLKEGDLIIADASEDYEGVCDCVELKNVNGAKIVSGLHTFAARAKQETIVLGYRTYALQHEQVIRELRRIATGTSVYGVSKTNLSKVKIPLPPLPEQKAIAQVLSKADAAIHTTEKLIAQKVLRKKWLMQQLLTGKKRLKGFDGVWKEVRLGSVCELVNGMAFKPEEWTDDGIPIIRIQNLNGSNEFNYFDREVNKRYLVFSGDLLFAWSGSRGTSFGAFTWFGKKAVLNQHIFNVYPKNGLIRDFAFQLLKYLTIEIERKAHGSAGLVHVTKKQLEMELMRFPKEKEEQTAIAQVLQAADKEISLLKAKVEKLRVQKKGLMQQLLTGRVRLKID